MVSGLVMMTTKTPEATSFFLFLYVPFLFYVYTYWADDESKTTTKQGNLFPLSLFLFTCETPSTPTGKDEQAAMGRYRTIVD